MFHYPVVWLTMTRRTSKLLSIEEQKKVFCNTMDKLVENGIYLVDSNTSHRISDVSLPAYYINRAAEPDLLRVQASRMLMTFRQLRETITATRRIDTFAVQVYERSVEIALLARDTSELMVALGRLIDELYPIVAHGDTPRRSLFIALRLILLIGGPISDTSHWMQLYTRCSTTYMRTCSSTSSSSSSSLTDTIDRLWYGFAARISQAYRQTDWSMLNREKQNILATLATYDSTLPSLAGDTILIDYLWELIKPSWRHQVMQVLRASFLQLPIEQFKQWLGFDLDASTLDDFIRTQAIALNDNGTTVYLRSTSCRKP
ncbi:hypothetical protein BDF22DRAFT_732156 [Syncephalis plumigaleata]|nr:hypothetical protein BDF22DRAFT_732156 [Syncephalis plumigaleata]